MEPNLIAALGPAFAAGFSLQRLLEILDPLLTRIIGDEKKRIVLGLLSLVVGLILASALDLHLLTELGVSLKPGVAYLDYLVTALVISAGTEGFNSILKFLSYKKEETKAVVDSEVADTFSARTFFERRLNVSNSTRPSGSPGTFVVSGDLGSDLAKAFQKEIKVRWPDQFEEDGWQDRTFDAYITEPEIFKMQDAATEASDIVARAYGVELSDDARLRIQNRVSLKASPKKLLPVMEDEVASA